MRQRLAASPLLLAAAAHGIDPVTLRLRPTGDRVLVDGFGRERAFHGTNAVVKGPPWVPSRGAFDPYTSLTAKDFELMQSAGINLIRLGVMWPGVEPVRGEYNESYMDVVRSIVEEAATYGIYTLADMHADVLSERFCGEGIPAWASEPNTTNFPEPLAPPYETDPATGFPTRQECSQRGWADYGGTEAAASAWERLYTNYDNLTDAWGGFWAKVAGRLASEPGLLGLELLNEPWSPPQGDQHANKANRELLQPSYDILARHIRAVAPEALIFFSGAIGDRTGDAKTDALPLGFDHAPGGDPAHSAIAFHSYLGQNTNNLKGYYQTRINDARNLSTGLLLTETGSFFIQQRVRPVAESMGLSWIQWEWKDFCKDNDTTKAWPSQSGVWGACKTGYGEGPWVSGTFSPDVLKSAFARPYASAIAGNFTSAKPIDLGRQEFELTFALDPTIRAPTELSLPPVRYPDGFTIEVSPTDVLDATIVVGGAHLTPLPAAQFGQQVTIVVKPK